MIYIFMEILSHCLIDLSELLSFLDRLIPGELAQEIVEQLSSHGKLLLEEDRPFTFTGQLQGLVLAFPPPSSSSSSFFSLLYVHFSSQEPPFVEEVLLEMANLVMNDSDLKAKVLLLSFILPSFFFFPPSFLTILIVTYISSYFH